MRAGLLSKLLPDEQLDSVFDLDVERLKARGIRGLVFDLDNTLGPWGFTQLDERTRRWLRALEAQGFRLGFVSNDGGQGREALRAALDGDGHPVVFRAGKPGTRGLRQALEALGLPPERVALVGDQLFTDVLAAKRLGLYAIRVKPLADDPHDWGLKLRRGLERLVLRWASRQRQRQRQR